MSSFSRLGEEGMRRHRSERATGVVDDGETNQPSLPKRRQTQEIQQPQQENNVKNNRHNDESSDDAKSFNSMNEVIDLMAKTVYNSNPTGASNNNNTNAAVSRPIATTKTSNQSNEIFNREKKATRTYTATTAVSASLPHANVEHPSFIPRPLEELQRASTTPNMTMSNPITTAIRRNSTTTITSTTSTLIPGMLPLRRSTPIVSPPPPLDETDLLQPAQPRLVKVQPEDGQRRPGAYALTPSFAANTNANATSGPAAVNNDYGNDRLDHSGRTQQNDSMMHENDEEHLSDYADQQQQQNDAFPPLFSRTITTSAHAGDSMVNNDQDTLMSASVVVATGTGTNHPDLVQLHPDTSGRFTYNSNNQGVSSFFLWQSSWTDDSSKTTRRRRVIYGCAGIIVLVIIIIGVGVGLSKSSTNTSTTTPEAPTSAPSIMIDPCSMDQIMYDCVRAQNSSTIPKGPPSCIMKSYTKLQTDFIPSLQLSPNDAVMNINMNSCTPENLALLSLSFFLSDYSEVFLWDPNNDPTFSEALLTLLRNRFGLALLFFSTNGKEWSNHDGWITLLSSSTTAMSDPESTMNHCNWKGVACRVDVSSNISNAVESIDLATNQLKGYLPSSLPFVLFNLHALSVGNNELTGTLPTDYSVLETLLVFTNKLNGTLSTDFYTSSNTVALEVSHNEFDRSPNIPFFLHPNWEVLSLVEIDLEPGPLPAGMYSQTMLSVLSMDDTNLEGTLSTFVGQLTSLSQLSLRVNKHLNGTLPTELGNLTMLNELYLGECSFSGQIPTEMGQLTSLTILSLEDNELTGPMPSELGLLTNLESFWFWPNKFSGTIPIEVCALHSAYGGKLRKFGSVAFLGSTNVFDQNLGNLACPMEMPECGCE